MSRIVALAGDGPLANAVARLYRESGDEVHLVPLENEQNALAAIAALGDQPVDVLIVANGDQPPASIVAGVSRKDLTESLRAFTFLPFRLAVLLRPNLTLAGGRAVLLTTQAVTMDFIDDEGRYLERPFRAAAHALWKCLSVEWQPEGICCALIAMDDAGPLTSLPGLISSAPNGMLVDSRGRPMSW
ncbi:MAG: hypothetical protein P4M09_05525 [Devosia sp.]|nr:hypothetical protein [Devosia sp.]